MKIPNRTLPFLLTLAAGLCVGAAALDAPNSEPARTVLSGPNQTHELKRGAIVVFNRNVELTAGQSAETVVVIGGSAMIHGRVRNAVVAIGGQVDIDGTVNDAAVAVLGHVNVEPGGDVHGDAVAVGGRVSVGDGATVRGDVVSVGGTTEVSKGAIIRGEVQEVGANIPGLGRLEGLADWVRYCALELRPLAPQVRWVWVVAGIFTLIYLLVALAFPKPVQVCASELARRPATTFAVGLLVNLLVPVVILLLVMTGIGILVVPLLCAALFFTAIVGKVALLEQTGAGVGSLLRIRAAKTPLVGFVIGTIVLTLLYLVPIIGFIAYTVFGLWGLGVAITAGFGAMRRERPAAPPPPPPPPPPAAGWPISPAPAATAAPLPAAPPPVTGAPPTPPVAAPVPPVAAPPVQPALPAAWTYPKAGFWERMAAGFLDWVIVAICGAFVGGPPWVFVVALAYFAGLWTWRGTTLGGSVLKLQVVRQDGGPLTFPVALVRALAAAFSAMVLFLGFFWIGWDPDKQGWHDKIAGTVVARLPRAVPLVCL